MHSPVATCFGPWAEADYTNEWDGLKKHRYHFESCCGNVMNLQSDYSFGHTTAYTCRGKNPARGGTQTCLSDSNILMGTCAFL